MSDPRVVTSLASFRAAVRERLEAETEPEEDGDAAAAPTADDSDATSETTRAVRVPVEVRTTVDDPFLAYRRARGSSTEGDTDDDGRGSAVLETTGGQPGWGYFGVDPVDRLTVGPDGVSRRGGVGEDGDGNGTDANGTASPAADTNANSPTLAALESLLEETGLVRGECSVPYPCGAIGWLSYDVARELEALPESAIDDRELPRLEVGVYDRLAAWEEPTDGDSHPDDGVVLRVTACPRLAVADGEVVVADEGEGAARGEHVTDESEDGNEDAAIEAAYDRGRKRALELARAAREGDPTVGDPPVETPEATFESDCGREAFAERVARVKEYVRDGDTFQANISQRLTAPAAVHPVAAYDALRRVNPAPYSCLLEFPAADLVSASPELLLERDGDFVRTEPIAGTRPRGGTSEADRRLAEDLRTDEKERAEHAMLVDLERNDLGKVCAYGSVDVEEYRRIDRYSEVMHLVSNVTGRLREGQSLADAIAAVFPGGTITGAPKPRTMEIIDELEATRRGPYTGSVGVFGFDGRATLNIVIRTLVRHADEYHLRVGAGIVHDSDPYREYDETLDKARALITAVDEALGDRAGLALEAESSGDQRE